MERWYFLVFFFSSSTIFAGASCPTSPQLTWNTEGEGSDRQKRPIYIYISFFFSFSLFFFYVFYYYDFLELKLHTVELYSIFTLIDKTTRLKRIEFFLTFCCNTWLRCGQEKSSTDCVTIEMLDCQPFWLSIIKVGGRMCDVISNCLVLNVACDDFIFFW